MQRVKTRKARPVLLGLLLLTALVYANAVGNDFAWDDEHVLVDNGAVQDLSNFPRFFVDPATGSTSPEHVFYRPLRTTAYALGFSLWGMDPHAYHALNVALHLINVALVFFIVLRLNERLPAAVAVTALFAVHPILTEAVASVTGLADVLFATFYLLAFWLHLAFVRGRPASWATMGGVVLAYVLALLSKEMALSFPLVVVMTDTVLREERPRGRSYAGYLAALGAVTLGFVALRTALVGAVGQGAEFAGATLGRTLLMQAEVVTGYLRLIVLPVGQSVRHSVWIPTTWLDPRALWSMLVVAAVLAAGLLSIRRRPHLAWGIGWFFVTLLPVMNLVPIRGSMMGERFCYLPALGILYALYQIAEGVKSCLDPPLSARSARADGGRPDPSGRIKTRLDPIAALVLAVVVVALGVLTVERNRDWKDSVSLLEAAARTVPDNNAIRFNLVGEYHRIGEREKGRAHYMAGLANARAQVERFRQLGDRAFGRGRTAEARIWYRRILEIDNHDTRARKRLDRIDAASP